jgi:F-type H+-transporting ATPase subunit epsilon|tara:strand:- start:77 stop:478 length:402 start_codon:yes stop_codon:yes gene_type:complete
VNTFTLRLQDARHAEQIDGVRAFVAEDDSGSFGILANHARMITTLVVGLARFRCDGTHWRYVAMPGAVVYFRDNVLTLSTRHYFYGDDYTSISDQLREELLVEEKQLHDTKESLRRMEEALLTRLWEMGREPA